MSKSGIIGNGIALFLLGIRIEMWNRVLLFFFRGRRFMLICPVLDRHLENLRKEFLLLEARHIAIAGRDNPLTSHR